jgi:hypothetical protein
VMDGSDRLVSRCRDDRAAEERSALGVVPQVPKAGEHQRLTVGPIKIEGLLRGRRAGLRSAPLIETRDGQQCPTSADEGAEGWSFCECLRAGVDQSRPDPRVLGPTRDESPAERPQLPGAGGAGRYGVDGLGWCDIPANRQLGSIYLVHVEQSGERVAWRCRGGATAHAVSVVFLRLPRSAARAAQ